MYTLGEDDTIENFYNGTRFYEVMDDLGYGNMYTAEVMGSIFVFQVLTAIALIFIAVGYFFRNCSDAFHKIYSTFKAFFMWNWCIRLVLEATMELSFCIILNIRFGP